MHLSQLGLKHFHLEEHGCVWILQNCTKFEKTKEMFPLNQTQVDACVSTISRPLIGPK